MLLLLFHCFFISHQSSPLSIRMSRMSARYMNLDVRCVCSDERTILNSALHNCFECAAIACDGTTWVQFVESTRIINILATEFGAAAALSIAILRRACVYTHSEAPRPIDNVAFPIVILPVCYLPLSWTLYVRLCLCVCSVIWCFSMVWVQRIDLTGSVWIGLVCEINCERKKAAPESPLISLAVYLLNRISSIATSHAPPIQYNRLTSAASSVVISLQLSTAWCVCVCIPRTCSSFDSTIIHCKPNIADNKKKIEWRRERKKSTFAQADGPRNLIDWTFHWHFLTHIRSFDLHTWLACMLITCRNFNDVGRLMCLPVTEKGSNFETSSPFSSRTHTNRRATSTEIQTLFHLLDWVEKSTRFCDNFFRCHTCVGNQLVE